MWTGPSKKGANGFSDVMQADDVKYDITIGIVKHASQWFEQNTVTFIF